MRNVVDRVSLCQYGRALRRIAFGLCPGFTFRGPLNVWLLSSMETFGLSRSLPRFSRHVYFKWFSTSLGGRWRASGFLQVSTPALLSLRQKATTFVMEIFWIVCLWAATAAVILSGVPQRSRIMFYGCGTWFYRGPRTSGYGLLTYGHRS